MKTEKIQELIYIIKTLPIADFASSNENTVSKEEAEKIFRAVINARLKHCLEQLKAHAKEAVYLDGHGVIVWKSGHFSILVYDALLDAQTQGINEWNNLVWQQIIRQMATENYEPIYYNIATEFLLYNPVI